MLCGPCTLAVYTLELRNISAVWNQVLFRSVIPNPLNSFLNTSVYR